MYYFSMYTVLTFDLSDSPMLADLLCRCTKGNISSAKPGLNSGRLLYA